MRSRRARPLTRDELLDAALRIVDSEGLPALTMRRLADAVGVEAMSLYHHVPGKDALLDWTLDRMRSEMRLPDTVPESWLEAMATVFGEYRRVIAAHPNMLPLAGRRTSGATPSGLEYLVHQGFRPDDAVELYQSLVAFTIGFSMLGAPAAQVDWSPLAPGLAERSRDWRQATFERTLRMILEGYGPVRGSGDAGVRPATWR